MTQTLWSVSCYDRARACRDERARPCCQCWCCEEQVRKRSRTCCASCSTAHCGAEMRVLGARVPRRRVSRRSRGGWPNGIEKVDLVGKKEVGEEEDEEHREDGVARVRVRFP